MSRACVGPLAVDRRAAFTAIIAVNAVLCGFVARSEGQSNSTGFSRPAISTDNKTPNVQILPLSRPTFNDFDESRGKSGDLKPRRNVARDLDDSPIRPASANANEATDVDLAEPLYDVIVQGNSTIPVSEIGKHIRSRPGRPASAKDIKSDVEALVKTRWFATVEPILRATKDGNVLVFRVLERPIVRSVEYKGNRGIKTDKLAAITQLKIGSPYDVTANKECARRLQAHYHEKGYTFATVELERGDSREDREVVFGITEGPKVAVSQIAFEGNQFFSDPLLKMKTRTKTKFLWLFGGKYDPSTIQDDIAAVKQYYRGLGFFDVKVEYKVDFGKDVEGHRIRNDGTDGSAIMERKSQNATIVYNIEEGERYRIRKLEVAGNEVIPDDVLLPLIKIKEGDFFNAREIQEDVERIRAKYGEQGRIFTTIDAIPRFLKDPGQLDLKIQIGEGNVTVVREFRVHVLGEYPHTRLNLVRNISRLQPGDLADPKKLKLTESRLAGSQYFEASPQNSPKLEISRVDNSRWVHSVAENDDYLVSPIIRGQSRDLRGPGNLMYENTNPGDPYGRSRFGPSTADDVFSAPPPDYIDIDAYVTEARTGRLMFGVGVNSNSGLIGNAVISEQNFDIFNPPTSFDDIMNGTAWRGAGQKFRIEAQPGTQVSRYLIDWSDPYFLDTDYNLGVSGFYYNRYLEFWTEQRAGGRIRLGKQFTQQISGSAALRLEDVRISNAPTLRPKMLDEAVGDNFLSTVRLGLAHDTRDGAFLPSAGHFVEASYEQAFGNYLYPRLELDAQQYFTMYRRPDGFGKHILSLLGQVAWTGNDTPIFERMYAGGFQSFRGFRFRGLSPVDPATGVRYGGQFMALGTVEYMLPVVANENVRIVGFTDFGTVDNDVTLNNFRASLGVGLRLTIPAMGPVPLAFDFAVPVVKDQFDRQQVFSFYVGLTR